MEKFTRIIESLGEKLTTLDTEYEELQKDLIEKVETGTNSNDASLQVRTIENYIEDNETTIIGLVNDSEIFDFYMKHRNQIDSLLSQVEHFTKSPESIGALNSVYEYIIVSTKLGITEAFKKMINKEDNSLNEMKSPDFNYSLKDKYPNLEKAIRLSSNQYTVDHITDITDTEYPKNCYRIYIDGKNIGINLKKDSMAGIEAKRLKGMIKK